MSKPIGVRNEWHGESLGDWILRQGKLQFRMCSCGCPLVLPSDFEPDPEGYIGVTLIRKAIAIYNQQKELKKS